MHAGAVIGADGFGMAEEGGRWLKIPQVGRVVIGADCEIGANTTIDRGAIDDTVIEDDVKLDNQIQIGHNCRIGAHTAIAGCVGIAGSARIGRNCQIGGAAMIAGHLDDPRRHGDHRGGTLSSQSITDAPGVYTARVPALPHRAVAARRGRSCASCDELAARVRRARAGAARADRTSDEQGGLTHSDGARHRRDRAPRCRTAIPRCSSTAIDSSAWPGKCDPRRSRTSR